MWSWAIFCWIKARSSCVTGTRSTMFRVRFAIHSPSFLNRGLGLSPTSNRPRPAGTGAGRFSEVWLHSLCLLRYCFSANKTFPNAKTARKIDRRTEKSAKKRALARPHKKENRGCFYSPSVSSFGCLIFKAPSMAPSTIGRYCSGQSFSLWLTRFRSSLSSRMTSGLK